MLFLLGLNHKTAPVEVRERLALPVSRLGHALDYVANVPGISETAILSTCNRVEIYAWGNAASAPLLRRSLADFHGNAPDLDAHLYLEENADAAFHLFRVASGLDSLVLGENEILGQIKRTHEAARLHGVSGNLLDELFRRAISCGKKVRSQTGISKGASSVGAAAVELARSVFGDLKGHTILILGAGKMSARVAQCLVSSGAHRVFVANRTFERATELARVFDEEGAHSQAVHWDEFPAWLKEADIVISSTGAPHTVVSRQTVEQANKNRRRPLLLIDIAVPRDIESAAGELDNVFLFDIDDLHSVVEAGKGNRAGEIAAVEAIIESEIGAWHDWQRAADAGPTMARLARHAAAVRETETEIALAKLAHLSERDKEIVAALGRAVSQKLIHAPLSHLRKGGASDAEAIRRAFGLDDEM